MRVLINGNLGYIGPIVVRHFRTCFPGVYIVGFDTGYFKDCLIDPNKFPDEPVDLQLYGDVRNLSEEALLGVDAIVQLAAISNDPMGNKYERATGDINATAAAENARRAKRVGVKTFVFASSCSVYGAGSDTPRTEQSPLDPITAYARSKIAAERSLMPLADDGFRISCLRFATACGFSPRLRLDLVLNDFVASAIATGKIEILSDGEPWRPLIHVADMARAMEWAISGTDGEQYRIVNVGSNAANYRIRDLAGAVKKQLPDIEIATNKHAASDRRSYRVDFSSFKKLAPAHQPQATLESAIKDLIKGLRACNFADATFRDSIYIRLKVLERLQSTGRISGDLFWT